MKINKDVEQAMRSLIYLSSQEKESSARLISAALGIPGEKLGKILQKLARNGLIRSGRGRSGGYTLRRSLDEIHLSDIYRALDEDLALVPCLKNRKCPDRASCSVQSGIMALQNRINGFLSAMSLSDIAGGGGAG
jgi:Rrf2 family nitric oxide-sensitive transcriptional repressor